MLRHSWLTPVDGSSSEQTTDKHFGSATSRTTSPATSSHAHVKVLLVSFAAWYSSAQVTAQLSPMVLEAQSGPDKEPLSKKSPMEHVCARQVGYGSVGSLTKAPSEPQVKTVAAANPEISALHYEQLAVQDSPKTVFGQS